MPPQESDARVDSLNGGNTEEGLAPSLINPVDADDGDDHFDSNPPLLLEQHRHRRYDAIQWPPPAFQKICVDFQEYLCSMYVVELALCIGLLVLAKVWPPILVPLMERELPTQTTAAGDVSVSDVVLWPLQEETVPMTLLTWTCLVAPLIFLVVVGTLVGPTGNVHASVCTFLTAGAMEELATECIKLYVGYLRPDFVDRCSGGLDSLGRCMMDDHSDNHLIQQGRHSFPSGHAGMAFYSMTTVTLYILGKWRLHRSLYDDVAASSALRRLLRKWGAWLSAMAPMGFALFVMASRVRDNWHHPADVIMGLILGCTSGLFAHGLWYPPIHSRFAGVPLETVYERKRLVAATTSFPSTTSEG